MKKVEYYYTDGISKNPSILNWLPAIIMLENRKVTTYWVYTGVEWLKRDGNHQKLDSFRPIPKRISKRKAEEIMFLEGL